VIERGGGARLALESLERQGVFGKIVGQKLQRDATSQAQVFREVDNAHPPPLSFSKTR